MDDVDRATRFNALHNADALEARRAALANRPKESALYCLDCGDPIPKDRQIRAAGCDRCFVCQTEHDKRGNR
jgi:RNA polymerase-binding transcription factor DksA